MKGVLCESFDREGDQRIGYLLGDTQSAAKNLCQLHPGPKTTVEIDIPFPLYMCTGIISSRKVGVEDTKSDFGTVLK
jgi:hypothetical protein